MNQHDSHDDGFERRLRAAHATAVDAVAGRTRLQLQLSRGAAAVERPPARGLAWPMAAACAAAALAIGLQWRQPDPHPQAPLATTAAPAATPATATATAAAATADEAYLALEESPDLYLWLASEDAAMLAME